MAEQIKPKVQQQMKDALKAGRKERLAVLRMILNEITATQVNDPSADELACVRAYHKKLTKARPDYEKAGAAEQVAQIDREIAVVEEFMPASLPDAELEQIIEQTLRAGNFTQKDFGKAMKEVMAQVAGLPSRPDGGRVSAILKAKLAGHG